MGVTMPVVTGCRAWNHLAGGSGHGEASCCLFGTYGHLRDLGKVFRVRRDRPLVWKRPWKRFELVGQVGSGLRESPGAWWTVLG